MTSYNVTQFVELFKALISTLIIIIIMVHTDDKKMSESDYVCTLDAAAIKKAREELHEIAEDRMAAVQALREWVEHQPHIKCKTDTLSLLTFLRGTKFSQLRAHQMIEGQMRSITQYPNWFRHLDCREVNIQKIINSKYIIPLPKRDQNGCRISMYRLAALDPNHKEYSVSDTIRTALLIGLHAAKDEMTQVNGHIFIVDFTGITMKHITSMLTQDYMKKWHKAWQKNMPGRFKAFHYYNAGVFIDSMMTLAKPFLDKKLQDRIYVHNTLESLYKEVSPNLLPEEYLPDDYEGPTLGTMQHILDNYKKELEAYRDEILYDTSDKFGLDTSVQKKPTNGQTELFRKLNVN